VIVHSGKRSLYCPLITSLGVTAPANPNPNTNVDPKPNPDAKQSYMDGTVKRTFITF